EKEIQKEKEKALQEQYSIQNITTDAHADDFHGKVSRTVVVLDKSRTGGIALVDLDEEVPLNINYKQMINIRGVVLAFPDGTLYSNGVQIWKRPADQDIIQEQQ
ncbi:MAG: hypothetical protein EZS28_056009, partial [Streblomastix strix]